MLIVPGPHPNDLDPGRRRAAGVEAGRVET